MFIATVFGFVSTVVAQLFLVAALLNFTVGSEVEMGIATALLVVSGLVQYNLFKGILLYYPKSNTRMLLLAYVAMQHAMDKLSTAEPAGMDEFRSTMRNKMR